MILSLVFIFFLGKSLCTYVYLWKILENGAHKFHLEFCCREHRNSFPFRILMATLLLIFLQLYLLWRHRSWMVHSGPGSVFWVSRHGGGRIICQCRPTQTDTWMRASVPALDESLFIIYNLDLCPSCIQSEIYFVDLHRPKWTCLCV